MRSKGCANVELYKYISSSIFAVALARMLLFDLRLLITEKESTGCYGPFTQY